MRLAWVTPSSSTLARSLRFYLTKLCLFYLLWSYSPSYLSTVDVRETASHATPSPASPTSEEHSLRLAEQLVGKREARTPRGVTTVNEGPGMGGEEEEFRAENRLTPPFNVFPSASASATQAEETAMAVMGSTSRPSAVSRNAEKTPPLSPAPALSSSSFSVSLSNDPPSLSSKLTSPYAPPQPDVAHSWTFTPLNFTFFLLHLLVLLHCITLSLSGALLQRMLLVPPLSSIFSSGSSARAPTTKNMCMAKRWTRLRWQFCEVARAAGPPGLLTVTLLVALVGGVVASWLVLPALRGEGGEELVGWNAVPFSAFWAVAGGEGGAAHNFQLRIAEGYAATRQAAKVFGKEGIGGPWRWIVGAELLSLSFTLLQGLSPLLLSLGILPSFIPTPRFLSPNPPSGFPRTTPSTEKEPQTKVLLLPTSYVLDFLNFLAPPLMSLFQTLVLLLARYTPPSQPVWRRWVSFSTLVLINAVLSPLEEVHARVESGRGEVERVARVVEAFEEHDREDAEVEREKREEAGEEWVCTICFEGLSEAHCPALKRLHPRKGKVATWWTRCSQRRIIEACAMKTVHASCLASWFATQAFCPTCHHDARRPLPQPAPSSSSPSSPAFDNDTYPSRPPPPPGTMSPPLSPPEGSMTPPPPWLPNLPLNPPPESRPDYDDFPGAAAAARRARLGENGPRRRVAFEGGGGFDRDLGGASPAEQALRGMLGEVDSPEWQ
ncbi:hypothetical protein JCM11251_005604 [Rhodosporidiobolus azoricus]